MRHPFVPWLRLFAIVGLFAVARPALAEDPDAKARAQQLLRDGNVAVGDADYVGALEKFRAAYAAFPSPKILLNIGTALRLLGRHAEAGRTYEAYLKDPQAEPARVAELRRILEEIATLTGHLHLHVDQPSATLRVDGEIAVVTPVGIALDPGDHTVLAEANGFLPTLEKIHIEKGEQRTVDLHLRRPGERLVVVEKVIPATQRTVGVIVGSVGLAGVVGGLAAGGYALAQHGTVGAHCGQAGGQVVCDSTGAAAYQDARTAGTAATIAVVAGAVVAGAGLVVMLTSPASARRTEARPVAIVTRVGPEGAGLSLRVGW